MSGREVTALVVILVVLGVFAYDLFALLRWGRDATITRVVRAANRVWPPLALLVGLAVGAILGHLFLCPTSQ